MRSRASYQGHPIHPSLIPFPFAFLTGALLFDAVAWLLGWPEWWRTGQHLAAAGILTALLAAVPGVIDLFYAVPPRSSGRTRGVRHALLNLSAVTLAAVAWLVRPADGPAGAIVAIELVSVALLIIGSSMGGTLVTRNQISVDHRYAGAGKWKEISVDARPGTPVRVAHETELKVDQMKLVRAGHRRIVLARIETGYVAFDDRCTHRGGSLADGVLICGTVQCPWHGSQFDASTGAVQAGPAEEPIPTCRVEHRGEDVWLVP
jgi:nitrite reductase/ring-hydroxylating ferredoxin subunit/uncharacterized membrane protein